MHAQIELSPGSIVGVRQAGDQAESSIEVGHRLPVARALSHPGSRLHEVRDGALRIASELEVQRELGRDGTWLARVSDLESFADAVVQALPPSRWKAAIDGVAKDSV
jgi:hypothetical protein